MAVSFVFFIAMIVLRRLTATSPVVREQARLIFWGALLSFTLIGIWLVVTTINPSLSFTPLLLIPLALFPVFTAYAIIRYRLLSTDFFLSRIVLYAMLGRFGYGKLYPPGGGPQPAGRGRSEADQPSFSGFDGLPLGDQSEPGAQLLAGRSGPVFLQGTAGLP